ncbi:MAG TPA: helix-turn-helix domain-containing protein [Amycolatopsis sp.]|uniref:TetR/AcrR family transcriptional regulator n=1 Tax=Amycolatopsis sp. TaxID=37632 RepID=UPI002B4A7BC8|nr:helix-turn-helix domain-containing protein [Amycolatopsis sp.]HKS50179.1 helix-turn-helix domain-containing protein [Amycolatopsis sp.]
MAGTGARRMRADARRNRERLLTAADEGFREHGVEASLERIAREAGVSIGTLYAHFPSRQALAAALLRARHDSLFELGDSLPGEWSAIDALATWMRAVAAHAAAYRGLATFLVNALGDEASELHAECARMARITERLVDNARGTIGAKVTAEDVLAVTNAAAWTREQVSSSQADRLLDLALRGLRAVTPEPPL